ncbi:MAG: hypothetical protein LBR17_02015 [Bacteroidales bacterium]|jgi:hypothetical protein|nr:hypothetical protein [Bacteroidales bacterium]
MNKIFISFGLSLITMVTCFAQTDIIEINRLPKEGEPFVYQKGLILQNDIALTKSQVRDILQTNKEALRLYNTGKGLHTLADVLGYIGGFSI